MAGRPCWVGHLCSPLWIETAASVRGTWQLTLFTGTWRHSLRHTYPNNIISCAPAALTDSLSLHLPSRPLRVEGCVCVWGGVVYVKACVHTRQVMWVWTTTMLLYVCADVTYIKLQPCLWITFMCATVAYMKGRLYWCTWTMNTCACQNGTWHWCFIRHLFRTGTNQRGSCGCNTATKYHRTIASSAVPL